MNVTTSFGYFFQLLILDGMILLKYQNLSQDICWDEFCLFVLVLLVLLFNRDLYPLAQRSLQLLIVMTLRHRHSLNRAKE